MTLRSACRVEQSSREWIPLCTRASSANEDAVVLGESPSAMSLMCIRNKIGPKTVPFGTPEITGVREDTLPSTRKAAINAPTRKRVCKNEKDLNRSAPS